MKRFSWKLAFCVVPVLLAAAIVAWAYAHNGFKLGVDLVGGTILVYEVDESKKLQQYQPEQLAASIKRRISCITLARRVGVAAAQAGRAALAAMTAASISTGPPAATCAVCSPVAGLNTGVCSPPATILPEIM